MTKRTSEDGQGGPSGGGGHHGRKFRPKRLKTTLPRPAEASVPLEALPPPKTSERIAKVMARAGVASRREAEGLIEAGQVTVNGAKISSPALNVTPQDRISVNGKPLPARERTRLFMFHKPSGLVTTSADTHGRPTIFGGLPENLPRLISVGRLDLNTEGLLLLTNDGGLSRALELPATGWLRRYRVRAHGRVTQAQLDALKNGITVDGINYGAIEALLEREQGANVWLSFAMREGKNREIRNVLRELGLQVNRLIRISYGPFQLGELPSGAVEEVKTRVLREQLGERLVALSGADFSGPLLEHEPPRRASSREVETKVQSPLRLPDVRDGRRDSKGDGTKKARREDASNRDQRHKAPRRDNDHRRSSHGRPVRDDRGASEPRQSAPAERTKHFGFGKGRDRKSPTSSSHVDRHGKRQHLASEKKPAGRGSDRDRGRPPRNDDGRPPRDDNRPSGPRRPYRGKRDR